jgi:hypothetical protein
MMVDLKNYNEPMKVVVWMVETFGHPGIRWNIIDLRYLTLTDKDHTWFYLSCIIPERNY